jgi:hypothetical protein
MSRKQNSGFRIQNSEFRNSPTSSSLGHWILNSSVLLLLLLALPAAAQLGPFPIVTRQATFSAEIVKRDQDTLWVRRQTSDGRPSPQVGIALADVVGIRVPRPSIFDAAERIRTTPGATDAQFQAAHRALDRFILQTKPLRSIPGIPADEAILLKGRLYHQKGLWREALRQYEDLVANARPSTVSTNAQILAGVVYSKVGEHQFAVEYLGGMPLPEEDEELLSELLFGLGNAYFALENYDNALLSYLPLVVFYPYVHNNEPRGLAAALGCYAKLQEWEPLYRTIQEIQKDYPGTPAAQTADEFIAEYKDDLIRAGQFVDGDLVAPEPPVAPAAPQDPAPPEPSAAAPETGSPDPM